MSRLNAVRRANWRTVIHECGGPCGDLGTFISPRNRCDHRGRSGTGRCSVRLPCLPDRDKAVLRGFRCRCSR